MIEAPRLRKYAGDLRTFPSDASIAWRSAGWKGVWAEFRRRTLDRLGGYARRLVIETDLSQLVTTPIPEGVEIRAFSGPDWSVLKPVIQRGGSRQVEAAAAGRLCLVAWRGERAVGCAWLSEQMDTRHESYDLPMPSDAVYVWQVEVSPEERRRGIAAALVGSGLQHAVARGRWRSWAIIHPENRGSLQTIAKVGPSRVLGTVARVKVLSWMRSHYRELRSPLPFQAAIDAGLIR